MKVFYCDGICKSVKNKDHERRKFKSSYIYSNVCIYNTVVV